MNPALYSPRDFRWSQRDPRWSWKKLGTSGLTVGAFGCAGTSVNYAVNRAWLKASINRFARPGEFFDYANTHRFFNADGRIYWNSADSFSAGLLTHTYDKRQAWITLREVSWGTLRHWIVLLNADLAMDPWQGQIIKRDQPYWTPTGKERYFKLNR